MIADELPPGHRYLVDASAFNRSDHPSIVLAWQRAVRAGQLALAPVTALEILHSSQDEAAFEALDTSLGALRTVDLDATLWRVAHDAMRQLARRPLHHRVPPADLLLAAAAQEKGFGILHYDRHFDRLAEVLVFESRWIAPAGTLDGGAS